MARVKAQDKYGDWQCIYCGKYISDTRAVKRRVIGMWRVPLCLICDALMGVIDPEWIHSEEYRRGRLYKMIRVGDFERAMAKQGLTMDDGGDHDGDVYRAYVTRSGHFKLGLRRKPKE